jgi:hypothetical protein
VPLFIFISAFSYLFFFKLQPSLKLSRIIKQKPLDEKLTWQSLSIPSFHWHPESNRWAETNVQTFLSLKLIIRQDKLECSSKNVVKHLSLKQYSILAFLPITLPREPLLKGKAQYVWPPHYGNWFCKKGTRYLDTKGRIFKLASTRRSTVLSFPLLQGFLALFIS